jgi:hypothetical protein
VKTKMMTAEVQLDGYRTIDDLEILVGLGAEEGSRDSTKARKGLEEHGEGSESMTRLSRFTAGDALTTIGVLPTAVGLAKYRGTLREMAHDDGVVDAVNGDHERGEVFWFLVCGASMVLTGRLARWTQLRTGTLPASTGSMLLGIGAAGATLMPRSGFWTLSVPVILALEARRRGSEVGAASFGTSG